MPSSVSHVEFTPLRYDMENFWRLNEMMGAIMTSYSEHTSQQRYLNNINRVSFHPDTRVKKSQFTIPKRDSLTTVNPQLFTIRG